MTVVFNASALASADLSESPLAQPTAEPLSGEILTRSENAFSAPDGRLDAGTWETEPGVSRWEFLTRGEIIVVMSGRMTVQEDGAGPIDVTAGDAAIFPIGWQGVWTVHERLRKVYVVFAA